MDAIMPAGFVVIDVVFGKHEDYVPRFPTRDGYVEVPAGAKYGTEPGAAAEAARNLLSSLVGVHKKTGVSVWRGGMVSLETGVRIPLSTWQKVMHTTPAGAEPRFTFASPADAVSWCRRHGIADLRSHLLSKLALHGWDVGDDCFCVDCCRQRMGCAGRK